MLNLTNSELDDDKLANCLRDAPPQSIVMIEDVDSVFVERTSVGNGGGRGPGQSSSGNGRTAGVSFSGLLNALDGVAAQEGRIVFMSTNHVERLDEALIRPGRCDVQVEVTKASKD